MKKFMDEDFLLSTDTAKHLFHDFAEELPIIDYHCHLSPREIAEDATFDNITQVWLGGDHYKWRQMRSNGVEERFITGDASDREKFQKWAETLEMAVGNPLYHWSHLELQRYFDYHGALNGDTAEEVWNLCNEKLKNMSARQLILSSNVEMVGTTDDPIDDLHWHKVIAADESFPVKVLPSWRPDKAVNIEKDDFCGYMEKLAEVSEMTISTFADVKAALTKRMEYFNEAGCLVSDHGLEYVAYAKTSDEEVEEIFSNKMSGKTLTSEEIGKYKMAILLHLGREYHRLHWVMQLHYGVKRDNNRRLFESLGPDAGIDSISTSAPVGELADFLNALEYTNQLPKTIIYSLNPIDNAAIGTIIGCFQSSDAVGKIQQGSAWWFNDNKTGMMEQMTSLANLGLLGNFIGMLTDSRSFLSYTRHEYFRRIVCELIGTWVENGEYPADDKSLCKIIQGISYYNAKRYFNL
ncbi:MAG: glucuronate isomerase [Lachnospiraceae bacterium]|nr:glucuronate isomerase [Lachnospiraceae bacterium]